MLLLDSGAYVNASGMGGDTPLHDAVVNNHLEVCLLQIMYNALCTPAWYLYTCTCGVVVLMEVEIFINCCTGYIHVRGFFKLTGWLHSGTARINRFRREGYLQYYYS